MLEVLVAVLNRLKLQVLIDDKCNYWGIKILI